MNGRDVDQSMPSLESIRNWKKISKFGWKKGPIFSRIWETPTQAKILHFLFGMDFFDVSDECPVPKFSSVFLSSSHPVWLSRCPEINATNTHGCYYTLDFLPAYVLCESKNINVHTHKEECRAFYYMINKLCRLVCADVGRTWSSFLSSFDTFLRYVTKAQEGLRN